MFHIYILSDKYRAAQNIYKVGRHTGNDDMLITRYKTYLTEPILYYFESVKTIEQCINIENEIKKTLEEYRTEFPSGNLTEWYKINLRQLMKHIDNAIESICEDSNDEHGIEIQNDETNEITKDARLRKYLKCLEKERWENEEILLGAIIFNEGGSFELFKEFMNDEKYCKKIWNKNKDISANIIILMNMAKNDNLAKYKKACFNDAKYHLNIVTNEGISDKLIARIFYLVHNDKYIFDQTTSGENWYILNKYNIWENDVNTLNLQSDINETLSNLILSNYNEHAIKNKNMLKQITNVHNKNNKYLSKNASKQSIMNELKILYKQKNINGKMDKKNPFIFAFKNGVYDLKKFKFRLPKPEEFVMGTVNYNYSEINEKIEKTISYITKVIQATMPTEEDYKYLLKTISRSLEGHKSGKNNKEELYIWKGNGENGIDLLKFLMEKTYNTYFVTLEMDRLCNFKLGTQSISKKFGKNIRLIFVTEKNITLKESKLKQIFNYVPKFKIIIRTCDTPIIEKETLINKTRCINFPYEFVCEPKRKNEKKADDNLKNKINKKKCKLAFFHILLKFYKSYVKGHDLNPPKNVINEMKLIKSDFIALFMKDCIEITNNKKDRMRLYEMYNIFKIHYMTNYKKKCPSKPNFEEAIQNKGITPIMINGSIYYQKVKISRMNEFLKELILNE